MTGFWTELTPYYDWTGLSSPGFDAMSLTRDGDTLVMTDSFYTVQRNMNTGVWTRGNDVNDDFPTFNGSGSFTGGMGSLPDGRVFFEAPLFYDGNYHGKTIAYDPITLTWNEELTAPPVSAGMFLPKTIQVGDLVYFFGGSDGDTSDWVQGQVYDTATDTWGTLSNSPVLGFCEGAWVSGSSVYVMMDDDGNDIDGFNNHVMSYSPAGDSWIHHADLTATIFDWGNPIGSIVQVGTSRVLITLNLSGGTTASLWGASTDAPVDVDDPIDPVPGILQNFLAGECSMHQESATTALMIAVRLTGPPKMIPLERFTLGSP